MRLSTAVALALTLLLAVLTAGSAIVAPVTAAAPAADGSPASVQSQSTMASLESSVQDGDKYVPERADPWQVIRLNVTETGDVRWTLESRFNLSENETEDFREYAEAVANGDRNGGYDVDRYETARTSANRSNDREMAFENETWNYSLEDESADGDDRKLGVISYSFTWTNFAAVDGRVIDFGDAFMTEDGVWFSHLEDGQRLVVEPPTNYKIINTPEVADVRNGAVIYDGPLALGEGDFRTEFESLDTSSPNPDPDPNPGPDPDPEPEPEPPSESESFLTAERVAAAFGGFVLLIVAASLVISRYQRSAWPFDGGPSAGAGRPRATETDGSGTAPVASTPGPSGIEHEFDETEAIDAGPDADGDEAIDEELLSDDERVRRLLEQNGGRMKQATIVKETGWSDAKVSQLLSEMDDDDRIRKLRIGRENLITLPDVDPTKLD